MELLRTRDVEECYALDAVLGYLGELSQIPWFNLEGFAASIPAGQLSSNSSRIHYTWETSDLELGFAKPDLAFVSETLSLSVGWTRTLVEERILDSVCTGSNESARSMNEC